MIAAIEVEGIGKRFAFRAGAFPFRRRVVTALEGVCFSVAPGEAFGLVGPNGSGKTTLLRILTTVLLPSSGSASIQGHSISHVRKIKPLIGVVPARPLGFSDRLTARENLEFYAAVRGLAPDPARRRVAEVLDRFGLDELGERPFRAYSTGQRQRLNLARAMLHDPPVLLWDEPCAGLDPWVAREFRAWIREELVGRHRRTLLMATNLPEDVEKVCSRALCLQAGRPVWTGEAGRMAELWNRPGER